MTRWGGLCPQCGHIKKRDHGPGRYPGPDRCPECNWPMNVVDLDIVDGEPDDNQELVTDGGSDAGHDGDIARIHGPHRVPRIECSNCGHSHHIDAAAGEYQGECSECNAFLRRPTRAEERAFAQFMDWQMRHMEAGR